MLMCELKKIVNNRVNRALFAAVVVLAVVFSGFAISSFQFVDSSGETHTGISAARSLVADKNRWQGELTPETISTIATKESNTDWQSRSDIIYLTSEMLVGEFSEFDDYKAVLSAEPSQIASIYDIYQENLRVMSHEYGDTPAKAQYLQKQYDAIETPFYYEAYDSWDTMLLYGTTFSLILIIVISFITPGIFADEFRNHADAVFFSTTYGRSKAIRTKIFAGLIITTGVYWAGIALLSAISFAVMGVSGADTAYQFSQPYAVYSVTFSQMYGLVLVGGFVASLLSASICMLVASRTRKMSLAVAVPFVLFFVSPFVGRALPFLTFFTLTPDQLTNIMNCARIPYIYEIGGAIFRQIPFILVLYTVVAVVLLPLVHRSYSRTMAK